MFSTHNSCSDRKFVLDDFYNKITMLVQNVRKSVLIFLIVFPYLLQWGDLSVASLPPYGKFTCTFTGARTQYVPVFYVPVRVAVQVIQAFYCSYITSSIVTSNAFYFPSF